MKKATDALKRSFSAWPTGSRRPSCFSWCRNSLKPSALMLLLVLAAVSQEDLLPSQSCRDVPSSSFLLSSGRESSPLTGRNPQQDRAARTEASDLLGKSSVSTRFTRGSQTRSQKSLNARQEKWLTGNNRRWRSGPAASCPRFAPH